MQWSSELETTRRERKQLFFIVLFVYATMLTDIVRLLAALTGSGAISSLVNVVRNGLYVGVFAGFYLVASNKARLMGFVATMIYVLVLAISLLVNPQLQIHTITLTLLFVSRYVLGFVMIATLSKPVQMCRGIVSLAWLLPIYLLLYAVAPHNTSSGSAYSMSLSYNLMLPAMACLFNTLMLKEKKLYSTIMFVLAVGGILFYGSRGTLICVGIGVLYVLLLNREKYSLKKIIFLFLLVAVVLSVLLYKDKILSYLLTIAPNSRTLKLLANESFFWTSNRDRYFDLAKESLAAEPFRIYGLGGDAYYYSLQARKTMDLGNHSHNIFLEFLLSYGMFFGVLLCLAWLFLLVCAVIRTKNNPQNKVVFMLFVMPLLPYILISGSTCQSHYYWLQLGALAYCAFSGNKISKSLY